MKHKRLAAAVLAAALWLTGCGGAAAPAAPAGSGTAAQSTADTAVQTAQKDRITEQFTLEKTIRDEYGITQKLTVHVPQLVCDSPDAAYLNDELAAMYAADFRQYEDSPDAELQQDEWCPQIYINWDAYWYGDCVSLVVFRYDGSSTAGWGWRQLDVEIPLQAADPQPQTVLTDTYGSASVQLEGTQGTITLRRTPETAAWDTDYGIRLEQDRTYPILGIYNEYIDVCIGELGASFHPVVYLLTKDGVVEYVDVLHCLMFGSALVCQDPIYIANQGVALERSGKEVILRQEDGSVLELAPLTAEWNELELPSEVTGAFNDIANNQFDWMDVESGGYFQMGVQDNNVFYQGYADYLGVVPEGMVLGIFTNETPDGIPGITFVAAMKYDLHTNTLSLTMIDGPNPFEEGATQLQMIRCPDTWPQRVPLTAD